MTPDTQAAPLSAEELDALDASFKAHGDPFNTLPDGMARSVGERLLATITALQGELADAQNGWTKALNTASDYLIRAEAAESALTAERKEKASPLLMDFEVSNALSAACYGESPFPAPSHYARIDLPKAAALIMKLLTERAAGKASPHGGMERHVIYKALLNIASQYSYGTAGMCTDMTDAILALTAERKVHDERMECLAREIEELRKASPHGGMTARDLMADALDKCQYAFVDTHASGQRFCSLGASCVCERRAHDFIDRLTAPDVSAPSEPPQPEVKP